MVQIIIHWIVNALALFLVAKILPGFQVADFGSALIAVIVIGLVNALVKPILLLLTLPINLLTLGLFTFVINALMLLLASSLTPGFRVDGFGTAVLGSILLTIVGTLLRSLVP